jgi:DNA-binding response OmpR family regulator
MSTRVFNDVMIVDDDQAIVDYMVEALRGAGFLCCAAYDGESTLFAMETVQPALILLDFHLPDLTALDVVEQLRRYDLDQVPIILMTADSSAANTLPSATFPEYLLKPFTLDRLLECVRRYL